MTNLFEHHQLTIETTGDLATDPDQIDSLPTAYAPATLIKSQATGLDDPDPTRYEVDISVPIENTGRVLRTNLVSNPSFELNNEGVLATPNLTLGTSTYAPFVRAGVRALTLQVVEASGVTYTYAARSATTPVEPGQWVGANFPVLRYGPVSGWYVAARIFWFSSTGAQVGVTPFTPPVAPAYQGWAFARPVGQAPAGAATFRVYVYLFGSASTTANNPPAVGAQASTDGWLTVVADTEDAAREQSEAYFDGDTPDTQTRWYDWTGPEHASPSEEYAPDLTPQVGDDVDVWVSATGYGQQPLSAFSGRVESLTRSRRTMRRRDGSEFDVWWYHVAATDKLGVLARTRVGSTPWPEENVQQRWARIRALVPNVTIEADSRADQLNVQCAARDVDNVSALELLRDTVSIVDGVILDLGGFGVISSNRDDILSGPDNPFSLLHLPAAGFERGEDVLDYDLAINVARVTGKQLDAEGEPIDTTVTYTNSTARSIYGESAYSISGDGMAPTGGTFADTYAAQRAERLVDEIAEPVWRIDGAVTAVQGALAALKAANDDAGSGVYTDALQALIDEPLGRCVQFDGAPPGRDVFRVIGVRLTYGGARNEALELEVEPWQMVAPLPYVE